MTDELGTEQASDPRLMQALQDLLDHGAAVARLVARGRSAYDADEMLQAAAEALLLRAGESVVRIDRAAPDFIRLHPELRLRNLKDARNVVAHGYDIVDTGTLWEILEVHLPLVIDGVRDLLDRQGL